MTRVLKRVLITGTNGLLGQKLVEIFSHLNSYNLLLTSRQERSVFPEETLVYVQLDITNKQQLRKVVDEFEPEIIINTAAVTNVDECEKDREHAWRVNVGGVENLIYAAKLVGAKIIQVSTDYVFDGKGGPYDELARPDPVNYYGRTKLASENLLKTSGVPYALVRTMVLYGVAYGVKLNFALWVLKELGEEKPIRVAEDQHANPTLCDDLAYAILKIAELERSGLYHIAGPDLLSRYEFALAIARVFKLNKKLINPVKSTTLKQPAPRPMKSGFITLKSNIDLGIKMSGVEQGVNILKQQLSSRAEEAQHSHL